VAKSTQNQALNALIFLYKHVLQIELGDLSAVRLKRPARLPVVLSRGEVLSLIAAAESEHGHRANDLVLMLKLLYGCGLRRKEVCSLRVKDGGRKGDKYAL